MGEHKKLRLAYFTVRAPMGPGEAFIVTEMAALLRQKDVDLLIVPLRPNSSPSHGKETEDLVQRTLRMPLFSGKILLGFLKGFWQAPRKTLSVIYNVLKASRPGVTFKNLILLPKAIYLSQILKNYNVEHIHAHWASSPSTLAYIVSYLTGVPWSLTAHRWDIVENNMLWEKVASAQFVRTIDKQGKGEILSMVGKSFQNKLVIIHMGVKVSAYPMEKKWESPIIACVANLVPKKGHLYLLEACQILKKRGLKFKCVLVGEGPEKEKIKEKIYALGLEDIIEMRGFLPHQQVLKMLQEEVDIFVLPSIVTEKGEKEGIPVSLMEAMAFGIPVVSTYVGGIPELVEGAGVLVPEKNSRALAEALEKLIENPKEAKKLGEAGFYRVQQHFNVSQNVQRLLEKIKQT